MSFYKLLTACMKHLDDDKVKVRCAYLFSPARATAAQFVFSSQAEQAKAQAIKGKPETAAKEVGFHFTSCAFNSLWFLHILACRSQGQSGHESIPKAAAMRQACLTTSSLRSPGTTNPASGARARILHCVSSLQVHGTGA